MSLPKVIFEELSTKINEFIQSNPVKDVEKNIKSIAVSILGKMDLVTRDEFNVQQKMLQKIGVKVTELEQHIAIFDTQKEKVTDPKTAKTKTLKSDKNYPTQKTN